MLEERKNDLLVQIERVVELENKLIKLKEVEEKIKEEKEQLRQAMIEVNLKKWEMPNGTKITLVEDTPEEEVEVEVLDNNAWAESNTDLVAEKADLEKRIKETQKDFISIEKQIKKGRKGYVKITLA